MNNYFNTNQKLFSIVMAVYNTEDYLDEAILSVINQSIGFEENIQLILVDDGSTDGSKEILLKYQERFPDNIIVLSQENQGQASARNLGLQHVKGEYVNFLDSDDLFSENTLKEVYNFFNLNEDINIVSIPIILFGLKNYSDELNNRYYTSRKIDLINEPNNPLISASATFFNCSLIFDNNYKFEELRYSEDTLFVNKILLNELKFGVINTAKYYYRQRDLVDGVHDHILYDDYYYIDRFDEFHREIINLSINDKGYVEKYIQYLILYDLKCLFTEAQLKFFLSNEDNINIFFDKVNEILKNVDKENIELNDFLDNGFKKFLYQLKDSNYKQNEDSLINSISTFSNEDSDKSVKVSIIIPVYNVEDYLEECLLSVINQSLKEIEIICVNDGSTDNSLEILEKFAKKDSRIRIISKENGGQGTARNRGIHEAIGEYVGFVDSDDYICEDMFEKLYECSSKDNLDISMCYVTTFDESSNIINEHAWYYSLKCFNGFTKKIFNHEDTKQFTTDISVTPYNKLYNRSFLIENDVRFAEGIIFEDEVFFYSAYLRAKKVSIVPKNLYMYRINRGGSTVSLDNDNDFSDIIKVFQLIRQVLVKYQLLESYKKLIYNKFLHYCLLRYSQTSESYKCSFWKLMKEDFNSIICFDNHQTFDLTESSLISIDDLDSRVKNRVIAVCSSDSFQEFKIKDSEKLFSIVMAVYNTEDYLDEAILSVIDQSIGFVHNIQLILVDDGSTDGSKEILLKYQERFPDNIIVLSQENQGQASARNLGLQHVKGEYVNFLDSDDYLSHNTLKEVYEFFIKLGDETDVVSIPIIQFGRISGPHILNYKFSETRMVDLVKEPNNPQLSVSSSFIKADALKDLMFPTNFIGSEDGHVLLKVLLEKKTLGLLSTSKYYYRKREVTTSTLDTMISNFNHYTPRLKFHFLELINYSIKKFNEVPSFLQYSIIYDLQWILNMPPNVFQSELENQEFSYILGMILHHIDNNVIMNNNNIKDGFLKKYIYSLKNNKHILLNEDNVILKTNNLVLDQLKIHKIWLDIMEINDNNLIISGLFNSLFDRNSVSIIATKTINGNEEIYRGEYVEYSFRPDKSFLLDVWQFNSNFDIKIPLIQHEKSKIELFVCYHSDGNNLNYDEDNVLKFKLQIDFNKFCKISSSMNYIMNNDFIVTFKENSFFTSPFSFKDMFKLEIRTLKRFHKSSEESYLNAFKIRRLYLILYPFVSFLKRFKSIYLFSDRIEMAGDNAEALFDYSVKQKDSNLKYFIISENSEDFKRLSGKKNVVKFNSLKHKLLYLFADKIISSHPDEDIFDPFFDNYKLYSNLFSSKKYFLQHGVTYNDISTWLRKFDKNLSFITAVAQIEQNFFFSMKNGYDDEIIRLLGFPRYDKLNNNNVKRQILLMPTWVNQDNMDENKLKNTDYFKKLYELLHDDDLFKLCKEYNYEIIFRPHPMLLEYVDLFEVPDYIQIDLNKTYSELFNESSLLITDYSSVSFDFAYLKKPVIYYQYYNYGNFDLSKSYFNYHEMGFGEIIEIKKDLLNKLEYYLKNDCSMEKKYVDRVDNFFEFNDDNNCKRNYEWISNH